MIDFTRKPNYGFEDLRALVQALRAPDGCPWDRVQTHDSIRRNFIEEVLEACEAIDNDDPEAMRDELGDVLLHVVFHASIEQDRGRFTVDDVCDAVVKKMLSRHPALFGGEEGLSWDEIKRREKGYTALSQELSSVARTLPALWRAEKIQKKAAAAGYPLDLPAPEEALPPQDRTKAVGDALFAAVGLAIQYGVDPEQALNQRCDDLLAQVRREEAGREKEITADNGSK